MKLRGSSGSKPFCPCCQAEMNRVIATNGCKRRRECPSCGCRVTTVETALPLRPDYKHRPRVLAPRLF